MHLINDAVVRDGKLVLSNLPFANGQTVRVSVVAESGPVLRTIDEIHQLLLGSVELVEFPFENVLPIEDWDMAK